MASRVYDFDGTFFRGAKSDSDPGQIPLGYFWMAVNMLNTGGLLSCRPGYRCLVTMPKGNLQGATVFKPKNGLDQFVVVIDGIIYVSDWPFKNFRQLNNVRMSPIAKQVFWAHTEQSATRLTLDIGSAIEVMVPKNVLFIQDGGFTAPAWYDGSNSGHVRDNAFETPAGGPMVWVGDRLWVAVRSSVFASDIANPFSFREQVYLGGTTSFNFPTEVTAMVKTPSLEFPQLLVFTEENSTLIQADIRDRELWVKTPGMSREVFNVGCSSQRSIVSHFGGLTWFSASGIVFFNSAQQSKITARLPIRDNEMIVSKYQLKGDLSLVAGGAFGQYLLMSVPASDNFNKHTWVLNNASMQTISDDSGPSWSGFWIGTRPVEWVFGVITGEERIFYVSTDVDDENRLWEAFRPERLDNGCPITWGFETRGYFGMTSQQSAGAKNNGQLAKICYADIALTAVEGNVDIAAFYAGSLRGAYKKIMAKRLKVSEGSLRYDIELNADSELYGLKPQSRILRTEEVRLQDDAEETGSCPVESDEIEERDESFQLFIVGHGPATVRWIRAHAQPIPEDQSADGEAKSDETKASAIRFDGAGASGETEDEVITALATRFLQVYFSTQTETVSQNNFDAVGIGQSESLVTQGAADRAARIIAIKLAERELAEVQPPILSVGEGFA